MKKDGPAAAVDVERQGDTGSSSASLISVPVDFDVVVAARAARFQVVGHGNGHRLGACLIQADCDGVVGVVVVLAWVVGAHQMSAVAVD